jgi:hypothetical protein
MNDPIKFVLWAGAAGLVVTLVCALWIVTANAGSRNLALGVGALIGACVILLVQLYFELQGAVASEDFVIEVTTDYQANTVRTRQPVPYYRNIYVESDASKLLALKTPPPTKDDAPTISRDLAIASIVSFLIEEQPDWQLDSAVYKTASGVISTWQGLSTPDNCTAVTGGQLRTNLETAGNMFAGAAPMDLNFKLCLPPNSTIVVTVNSVVLTTRVCQISVNLREPFVEMSNGDPAHPNTAPPLLSNGQPRYANVVMAGRVTMEYFGLRAQARNLAKYQRWAKRIVDGLKLRFGNV